MFEIYQMQKEAFQEHPYVTKRQRPARAKLTLISSGSFTARKTDLSHLEEKLHKQILSRTVLHLFP